MNFFYGALQKALRSRNGKYFLRMQKKVYSIFYIMWGKWWWFKSWIGRLAVSYRRTPFWTISYNKLWSKLIVDHNLYIEELWFLCLDCKFWAFQLLYTVKIIIIEGVWIAALATTTITIYNSNNRNILDCLCSNYKYNTRLCKIDKMIIWPKFTFINQSERLWKHKSCLF